MITQDLKSLKSQFELDGFVRVARLLDVDDFTTVRSEFGALLAERVVDWTARGVVPEGTADELTGDLEIDLLQLASKPGFDTELLAELDITLPHAPFTSIQPDSPFHVGPGLLDLVSHPRVLDVVEEFVGPEITVSGNQHIRLKLPDVEATVDHVGRSAANAAAQTPWHTDAMTQVEESMATTVLTVWIPLRAVGPDDGCLMFVPGSHLEPDSVPWPLTPELREDLDRRAVRVPVAAGDVILLHRHVAHASAPNSSTRVRWSFDLRYYPTGAPGDRPWFPSIPLRSLTAPASVVTSGAEWWRLWDTARQTLAASGLPLPGRESYARAVAETHLKRWAAGRYC